MHLSEPTTTKTEHTAQSPYSWDDTARSLTIGRRHGSFDGIEKTRTFTVNVLGEEKTAVYNGKETVVSF